MALLVWPLNRMGASQDISFCHSPGVWQRPSPLLRLFVQSPVAHGFIIATEVTWDQHQAGHPHLDHTLATLLSHFLLPPLPEQRAIAAVLDSIDEAIERTEAVITATERLRDALLHELLTRGVPGWHSEWKDVPGIGTIPADWDVVRLGDGVTHVGSGVTPQGWQVCLHRVGDNLLKVTERPLRWP